MKESIELLLPTYTHHYENLTPTVYPMTDMETYPGVSESSSNAQDATPGKDLPPLKNLAFTDSTGMVMDNTGRALDNSGRSLSPRAKSLQEMSQNRKSLAQVHQAKRKSTKGRAIICIKFIGVPIFIVVSILGVSYILLFGLPKDTQFDAPSESPTVYSYQIQGVLPGRILSMSQNGEFAAIKDDFGFIQVYRKLILDDDEAAPPVWDRVGQTVKALARLAFSANGTIIAYLNESTQRPEVRQLDEERDLWTLQKSPAVVADQLSMDTSASLLVIGLWDRQWNLPSNETMDILVTYKFDGDDWVEYSERIFLEDVLSVRISPSGTDIVVTTVESDDSRFLSMYHLTHMSEEEGSEPVWQPQDRQLEFDSEMLVSLSLAESTFAVASTDFVQVYDYSGRAWGQKLEPATNGTSFSSADLNLDGTILALASKDEQAVDDSPGIVNFYSFPYYLDTGDAWEDNPKYPPLNAELISESVALRDEYGFAAPNFGSAVALDGSAEQILVQSGVEGNENVHFYGVIMDGWR